MKKEGDPNRQERKSKNKEETSEKKAVETRPKTARKERHERDVGRALAGLVAGLGYAELGCVGLNWAPLGSAGLNKQK